MCCLAYILEALFFFYRKIELGVSFHNSFIENKRNDPNVCKKHSWPAASIHHSLLLIMNASRSLPTIIDHAFNSELQWTLHPLEKREGDREGGSEGGKKEGREGWIGEGGSKRGRKRDKREKRKKENQRQKERILSTSFPFSFYFIQAHSLWNSAAHIFTDSYKSVFW